MRAVSEDEKQRGAVDRVDEQAYFLEAEPEPMVYNLGQCTVYSNGNVREPELIKG